VEDRNLLGCKRQVNYSNWSTPPDNVLKINCDGSYRSDSKTEGWGSVVRDSPGDIIGAGAGCLNVVASPARVEVEVSTLSIMQHNGE
jgi:hypothetical protein